MKDEDKLPRTIVNIDGELVEILDNALQYKRSQGDKWLKTRAQLIHIWLWEKANEWKESLDRETLPRDEKFIEEFSKRAKVEESVIGSMWDLVASGSLAADVLKSKTLTRGDALDYIKLTILRFFGKLSPDERDHLEALEGDN